MASVYLGLGSNIDAEQNLKLGIEELRRCFGELDLSPVYRSPAAGFDGDDFLNMVAGLDTEDTPQQINAEIERIHALAGRERGWTAEERSGQVAAYQDYVTRSRAGYAQSPPGQAA